MRRAVAVSAVCLCVTGAILMFLPDEAGHVLVPGGQSTLTLQLLGAALIGFGTANWTARGTVLGGIYGRAVVTGNQTHMTIGAFLLLKHGIESAPVHWAYWVLTGLYVVGAAFFVYLVFFSSGIPARSR